MRRRVNSVRRCRRVSAGRARSNPERALGCRSCEEHGNSSSQTGELVAACTRALGDKALALQSTQIVSPESRRNEKSGRNELSSYFADTTLVNLTAEKVHKTVKYI